VSELKPAGGWFTSRLTDAQNVVLFSGGHDSLAACHYAMTEGLADAVLHVDTGIRIQKARDFVEETCHREGWLLEVVHSRFSYADMVREYGFPAAGFHGVMYRNLKQHALRNYAVRVDGKPHFYTGIRRQESQIRFRNADRRTEPYLYVFHSPIFDWTEEEVEAYLEEHGLKKSPVKQLYHHSGECLCGAYANREEELLLLEAHFPEAYERLMELEEELKEMKGEGEPKAYWGNNSFSEVEERAVEQRGEEGQLTLCQSCIHGEEDGDHRG
jgi:3'-phosphoadenosine 5'-phosphosulfate sulfotransferase (PAPS reductase)/FAD synthetase